MAHKNVKKVVGRVFTLIGIVLVLVGVIGFAALSAIHNNFVANADRINAEIIDIVRVGEGYSVRVAYIVDGNELQTYLNFWHSGMRVGQFVELYVDRDNPASVRSTSNMLNFLILIPAGLGIIFGGIGMYILVLERRRIFLNNWLISYGKPVWANIIGVDICHSIMINNVPARKVIAEYNLMQFQSEPVTNRDLSTLGSTVRVYLHPDNPDIYYMNVAESQFAK